MAQFHNLCTEKFDTSGQFTVRLLNKKKHHHVRSGSYETIQQNNTFKELLANNLLLVLQLTDPNDNLDGPC